MPSVILGNPFASGGQILVSGNVWSGQGTQHPVGGILLKLHPNASGNAYIYMSGGAVHPASGGATVTSGGFFLSGGVSGNMYVSGLGYMDGMLLKPGESYFIPRMAFTTSGVMTVCAQVDAAGSGQSRIFWEAF